MQIGNADMHAHKNPCWMHMAIC